MAMYGGRGSFFYIFVFKFGFSTKFGHKITPFSMFHQDLPNPTDVNEIIYVYEAIALEY